jgi:hypothetical protein
VTKHYIVVVSVHLRTVDRIETPFQMFLDTDAPEQG